MKRPGWSRAWLAILGLGWCLATPAAEAPPEPGREALHAVLWQQTAQEYALLTTQIYASATRALDQVKALPSALADPEAPSPAPDAAPAIILDLDETVLETSRYGATLVKEGRWHREADWTAWVERTAEGGSGLVPGALDFLRTARDRGYRIFYVTNRSCPDAGKAEAYPHAACPQRAATVALARRLGLPFADDPRSFLLRNDQAGWESGDKTPRRRFLAGTWKVIMLVGDDLGDFLPRSEVRALRAQRPAGRTVGESSPSMNASWLGRFGSQWFLLPNPSYGSWEVSLATCDASDREGEECQRQRLEEKYRALMPADPSR